MTEATNNLLDDFTWIKSGRIQGQQWSHLETLAWTVMEWRMSALQSIKSGRPQDHLAKLEALRQACQTSLELQNADAVNKEVEKDASWITIANTDQLASRWHEIVKEQNISTFSLNAYPPLFGVPVAIKDNIDVLGFQTTAACPGFAYFPQCSATVVQHLQAAGALVLGKTNLDQFATGLVGTRSPYGIPVNAFSSTRISGGSSSGSAIVVARGLVPLALGTDTAGSGRVPAGFNNIIGVKPSKGLISTKGVVPACRTLDCVSIFALTLADAQIALSVCAKYDPDDPYSRQPGLAEVPGRMSTGFQVAVPKEPIFYSCPSTPDGADLYHKCYTTVCRILPTIWPGAEVHPVDFSPLFALAALLYEGPWVAERWAAVRTYVECTNAQDMDPIVLKIVREGSKKFDAADAFQFEYKAAQLRRAIVQMFGRYNVLVVPTTPMPAPTLDDVMADPVSLNAKLGTYTNFVNLADWCGLSLPAGFCLDRDPNDNNNDKHDPLAFGITLLAGTWKDLKLLDLGSAWLSTLDNGKYLVGATGRIANSASHTLRPPIVLQHYVKLAVVGAHMRGMPLNHQLDDAGAVFLYATQTAECYKLFALKGTNPPKPGLVRIEQHGYKNGGRALETEIYALPASGLGSIVAGLPPPLAIGSVECADGSWVRGFVCEPRAIDPSTGNVDVTSFRGWRHYIRHIGNSQTGTPFQTVLVANRGEIAVRCIRTLQQMGIRAVAVYAAADRYAQHVVDADYAVSLEEHEQYVGLNPADAACTINSIASETYLNIGKVIAAAKMAHADAICPGYGFLSESPAFVRACAEAGLVFIGPTAEQMEVFAHKHTAREKALQADMPSVPGTDLLPDVGCAIAAAQQLEFPVMVKSTAGGGGIGLQKCSNVDELHTAYERVARLGEMYFGDGGVFLEKCIENARHVEIQVIGDTHGHVIALGDRDCSLQRRHQKVIEEAPAPSLPKPTRKRIADCAVKLLESVKYQGAGTVEFLYNANTNEFYFLEVNARLQVEHPVTEMTSGIDIIEWMVRIASGENMLHEFTEVSLKSPFGHAIEVRVYAEDPFNKFAPSAGLLTKVHLPQGTRGVRVDGWIRPGTEVTSHFDPLLAKIIAHGLTRHEALANMLHALEETEIEGICTNVAYLRSLIMSDMFHQFQINTRTLDQYLEPVYSGFEVVVAGTATSVQDYPGRMGYWDVGVPPSGPMDAFAFRMANFLVGNQDGAPALECTLQGPTIKFFSSAIVAVTGAPTLITLDGQMVPMWCMIRIKPGQTLAIGLPTSGCRTYLAVCGSFHISQTMGSCSTFSLAGTGGFRGRTLRIGDTLTLEPSKKYIVQEPVSQPLDHRLIPNYAPSNPGAPKVWHIGAMLGPHAAPDYLTLCGLNQFLETEWHVSHNANRLGIRLIGPTPQWAREDGGEAGLHPSNILDCCYAIGSINLTGDTPTILTVDGPSLGGFVCPVTIVKAEMWKVGQLKPDDRVRIHLITFDDAMRLQSGHDEAVQAGQYPKDGLLFADELFQKSGAAECCGSPVLMDRPQSAEGQPKTLYRAAGDGALLLEYGEDKIDLVLRFRVHALMQAIKGNNIAGITEMVPGVHSLQIKFDPKQIHQRDLVNMLVKLDDSLGDVKRMSVPSRIIRLPLAFQDQATTKAVERYMQTVRETAPWLPDNVEFLRRINGLESKGAVRDIIYSASYLVLGLGDVYYGAPCALPIDPRHRLLSSKYNPARTFTPEGVFGIGGVFMCIYGINSPGGYQLIGRTLPVWDHVAAAKRSAHNSSREIGGGCPWMLEFFDQVQFYPVTDVEIERLRQDYRHGQFPLDVSYTYFDLGEYEDMLIRDAKEITQFKNVQLKAYQDEVKHWNTVATSVPPSSSSQTSMNNFADVQIPPGLHVPAVFASRVWKVLVQAGDEVEAGQTLVLVEAMKAELSVTAPRNGVVKAVLCEPGQFLEAADVVVVLDG